MRSRWKIAMTPTLHQLGLKHHVGKANEGKTFLGRNYLDIYEQYLAPLREAPIKLLEIGVKGGRSLRMWAEYFSRAQIYGLDIDPICRRSEANRIHVEVGSQTDTAAIARLCEYSKLLPHSWFDVIIDDGSHVVKHILRSFELLWPILNPDGGLYFIEDLECSYRDLDALNVRAKWPGMRYNPDGDKFPMDRGTLNRWILSKLERLDHRQEDVQSIHFWHELCVLSRGSPKEVEANRRGYSQS
jgi:hypothetical protein